MSYILEALRRAESERERKRGVPGLHAQPVPTSSADEARPSRFKPWWWVVLGVSGGVLLMALWRLGSGDAADDTLARAPVGGQVTPGSAPAAATGATAAAPQADAAAPPVTTAATAPPPTGSADPVRAAPAATPPAPEPRSRAEPRAPKAAPRVEPKAAPRSEPLATAPAAAPAVAPNSNAPRAVAPAQAAPPPRLPERLRSLTELPDDLRRSVPALSFGGSVYSDIATQRMVIFNGQVFREGDALGDDLMLEQIRPRSAVMRLRGERFEVTF